MIALEVTKIVEMQLRAKIISKKDSQNCIHCKIFTNFRFLKLKSVLKSSKNKIWHLNVMFITENYDLNIKLQRQVGVIIWIFYRET